MKQLILLASTVFLIGCAEDYETPAHVLLDEARTALANEQFDKAHQLVDSIRSQYPKAVNARREALKFVDSVELVHAQYDLHVTDSILTYRRFELSDMKSKFVLEKDAKYQSVGNYVTPAQSGDKSRFRYFTEVNEQGTMVLVSVDANRKYHPNEIEVEGDTFDGVYPSGFSAADISAFTSCYGLAKLFKDVKDAEAMYDKYATKVRFFQTKIEKGK